jgi:Peptidase A4 family
MIPKSDLRILTLATVAFLFCAAPAVSAVSAYSPNTARSLSVNYQTQTCDDPCFAGYALTTSSASISGLSTSVKVPSFKCGSTQQVVFFGIALESASSSTSAETGFYAECSGSSTTPMYLVMYYLPGTAAGSGFGYATWVPSAGNVMSFTLKGSASSVSVQVKDVSSGQSVKMSTKIKGASFNEAACAAVPIGYPQVNYRSVSFTDCKVTIAGKKMPISGDSAAGASLVQYVCYNESGTSVIAKPSAISSQGSFKVTYMSAGP